ncbi:restriction endonuclease-like protein [Clostridium sp. CX1]|uniref:restriction endonuclease-like protein n=1 Tax=Clostridium sp. CX1 TaxID=2978346 RepID=UPI0021BE1F2D|nr:restriction endonuclease-like protein [Clostridium sp. CX1]MCT8977900.1 restriction endonuclease-like protein [Clostridium sp. CX1]
MMALQRTGSSKTLLYIETTDFKLYITGNLYNKKFQYINANFNLEAHLFVDSDIYDPQIKTSNDEGELFENSGAAMRPSFFEDGIYQIFIENYTEETLELDHIDKEITEGITYIGNNLIGSFGFNGDIGHSTFKVKKNNKEVLTFTIEIFPSKMDYMKDYKEILNEVNEEIASMVFDFLGKTFQTADLKEIPNQTGIEFTGILMKIYEQLEKAIKRIESYPKHGVINREETKSVDRAKKVSRNTIDYIRKHNNSLMKSARGIMEIEGERYTPTKVVEIKKSTTFDIYENQYVKFMLKSIVIRVKQIKNNIANMYGEENEYFKALTLVENRLLRHLNGFFKNMSDIQGRKSMSLVFKMSSGYKEIYYYYVMLKKGLDISEGLYEMTPKKLWKLYEIWCYMKLHSILSEMGFVTVKNGIIETKDNGITLSLTQNKEAKTTYISRNGSSVDLWYNKVYSRLPTSTQRPDTVLCLRNNQDKSRVYIFDAKYRLSIDDKNIIGPMEDDINVMHRYRDAIVSEMDESIQFKYNTFGAYVMFPYSNEEEFKSHKFYKSIEKVNIGAFPMLPGSTNLIKNHLYKILNESYIESQSKLPTYEVEDDYYKFKNTNVMVANVSDREHLKVYIKDKFYHIPAKVLSNVRLGVEYIAFYQSKNYFGDNSGVYYYGKIKEIGRYKRKDCAELALKKGSGEEEYLRFELDEILPVGPISTVEYGVELITYTTMYLLKNAETIHELSFKSRIEIRLYKLLKEVSNAKGLRILRRKDHFMLGDIKIEILNSKKLRVDGKLVDIDKILEYFSRQ